MENFDWGKLNNNENILWENKDTVGKFPLASKIRWLILAAIFAVIATCVLVFNIKYVELNFDVIVVCLAFYIFAGVLGIPTAIAIVKKDIMQERYAVTNQRIFVYSTDDKRIRYIEIPTIKSVDLEEPSSKLKTVSFLGKNPLLADSLQGLSFVNIPDATEVVKLVKGIMKTSKDNTGEDEPVQKQQVSALTLIPNNDISRGIAKQLVNPDVYWMGSGKCPPMIMDIICMILTLVFMIPILSFGLTGDTMVKTVSILFCVLIFILVMVVYFGKRPIGKLDFIVTKIGIQQFKKGKTESNWSLVFNADTKLEIHGKSVHIISKSINLTNSRYTGRKNSQPLPRSIGKMVINGLNYAEIEELEYIVETVVREFYN